MMQYWQMAKSLTLMQAAIIAGIALGLALFAIRQGVVNTLLWIVALGALAIGGINKASYG